MLTPQQIEHYHEQGYLVLESQVPVARIAALRERVDALLEDARGLAASDAVYDLEQSHTPQRPRVRRIKLPHQVDPLFDELLRSEPILAPVRELLGPSLRLHSSKLNLKAADYGAAVEWHQDWAFYPHTNQDVLAVGVMLDDMTRDNGPLLVLPGSHRGPVFDHHQDGLFCGAISLRRSGLEVGGAVSLTGPAGSVSLHHARLVHGSDLNRSGRRRALLLYEIAAADAWPLQGSLTQLGSLADFDARLLCGEPTLEPRLEPVPVRMPLPLAGDFSSIYQAQLSLREPVFGRARGS